MLILHLLIRVYNYKNAPKKVLHKKNQIFGFSFLHFFSPRSSES
jgi:hypothetical protein